MYSYALLETGCYYLVQEKEGDPILLLKIQLESDHCVFVTFYGSPEESMWKRKNDTLFDILELLGEEKVREWEAIYKDSEDAYYEEDED
jgi:hypothetical protein